MHNGDEEINSVAKTLKKSRSRPKKTTKKTINLIRSSLDVNQIKLKQTKYNEEIKSRNKENKKLTEKVSSIKKDYGDTKKRATTVKMEQLEREKKKNNIVIQGKTMISNNPRKLKKKMGKFIKDKLEVSTKIKTALKIFTMFNRIRKSRRQNTGKSIKLTRERSECSFSPITEDKQRGAWSTL
ncbi:hypothetical protein FQA39_LY15606 [Lamprigera yunnana]|nr:hypothetical protein FQA39_LY15606 [Lamprigera yunnana]